ncbi:MAG: hypothetical protein M1404_00970 [Acidobacteria bacterium]|nr:hypothetical protein [Acidobacteriota bacterium]
MRTFMIALFVGAVFCGGTFAAQAVHATVPDVQTLFEQLKSANTSKEAADELAKLGKENARARKYLSNKLPELIENVHRGAVCRNAQQLAGNLKLTNAVPGLVSALTHQFTCGRGDITFTQWMRLDDDPAGRALVEIGEPSVGPVSKLLESVDKIVRSRATLVLLNIDSPAAIQAIRNHFPKEKDPGLKRLMANHLRPDNAK